MENTITSANVTPNSSVIVQGNLQQQQQQSTLHDDNTATAALPSISQSDSTSITGGGGGVGSQGVLSGGVTRGPPSSTTQSPGLVPAGKTVERNLNGTMVVISIPSNEAEVQLYKVLQRASLLAYYDTLLEMGGDDVQQLCDAGEEEFLEIMALVGMASKPLHVRRLQKSLHEWVNNPSGFQTPIHNSDFPRMVYSPEPALSTTATSSRSPFGTSTPYTALQHPITPTNPISFNQLSSSTNPMLPLIPSGPSHQSNPTLTDIQINRLTSAAIERLTRERPQLEPKPQNSKKRSSRELEQVMAMSENDMRRMDEIRKYAAIYGRFDCKRRPEKPLTLHEVCVNEAAAQICKCLPALLTRRDELFKLARQVVRDAGFGHSATIASFSLSHNMNRTDENETTSSSSHTSKRSRLSSDPNSDMGKDFEEPRSSLISIYQKLGKNFDFGSENTKYGFLKSDFDDADSQFSFCSSNSPSQGTNGMENDSSILESPINSKNDMSMESKSPDTMNSIGVQIISSSGGHIIAVANPALALSPALSEPMATVKRETMSPDI